MTISHMFAGNTPTRESPYVVTETAVERFARAIRAIPAVQGFAPPTFATVIAQPGQAKAVEQLLNSSADLHVVHLDQTFTHTRPIRVGDQLWTSTTIGADKRLGRHRVLTVSTEIRSTTDDLVCVCLATVLLRAAS
ncbi:MaoC family dehydratase N-terminal domain-containing protein [Nocardia sp. NPDC058058]|uniref:FAS1-like dehydratase domain-containing protein n=1 Tax=Nocardia sp. NPDC058058 TaxID=3346317 RepID=UPI0036D7736E